MRYEYYFQRMNKETKGRYDVTPLFADSTVLKHLVTDLLAPFAKLRIDKVAGIDALGFVLGGAIAQKRGVGFIALRKGGKLPGTRSTISAATFIDYTKRKKSLELSALTLSKGERVLLIDEWMETGAQMKSAVKLIEKGGGKIVGITCLTAERKRSTEILFSKYNLKPIHIQDSD